MNKMHPTFSFMSFLCESLVNNLVAQIIPLLTLKLAPTWYEESIHPPRLSPPNTHIRNSSKYVTSSSM